MMGAAGEPSGYYPIDSNGLTVQSELPAPCMCPVVVPVAPGVCPPLGYGSCEGGRCGEGPDLPYLNPSGTGGFPQFGSTTNEYYYTAFFLPPLLIAALRGCLSGVAIDSLISIGKWILCAITALAIGKSVVGACGSFPVPGLCDLIASCLAGALTGGILEKLFPRLKDALRDLIAGMLGGMAGGICQAITAPCPSPSPSPKPAPVSPSTGGSWPPPRFVPLPAV